LGEFLIDICALFLALEFGSQFGKLVYILINFQSDGGSLFENLMNNKMINHETIKQHHLLVDVQTFGFYTTLFNQEKFTSGLCNQGLEFTLLEDEGI